MIRSDKFLPTLFPLALGALILAPVLPSASAEEYIYGGAVQRIGDRCARLGEGFVDLGNGICGRVSRHIRVGGGDMNAGDMKAWSGGGGTTNAAMQSGGPSMVPGAEVTQRLRVRGNLDTASPFR